MRALYAAILGQGQTAPIKALKLAERSQWIEDHPGWTFRDYDEAPAGAILFHRDFLTMQREAERQALDAAKAKANG
jgi:hypothetical protein